MTISAGAFSLQTIIAPFSGFISLVSIAADVVGNNDSVTAAAGIAFFQAIDGTAFNTVGLTDNMLIEVRAGTSILTSGAKIGAIVNTAQVCIPIRGGQRIYCFSNASAGVTLQAGYIVHFYA